MRLQKLFFISVLCVSQIAFASERMGQARLFLGSTKAEPTELNTELTAQGLENVDLNNQFGVEILFPVMSHLYTGLRYSKRVLAQVELTNDAATDYQMEMTQNVFDFVARVPIVKGDIVRFDAVIGGGGSTSKYMIKTAAQDGSLERKGSPFGTPHAFGGLSVGLGYKKYYFVVEAGYDMNKVEKFSKSGNINDNVQTIDLSGSYVTIGLMFDAIPIFKM